MMLAALVAVTALAAAPAWPPPPDRPRILHAGFVPDPAARDAGPRTGSWLARGFRLLLGLPDHPAEASTRVARPTAISVRDGVAWIADPSARTVTRRVLAGGRETAVPKGRNPLVSPAGVASAPGGRVFIADAGAARVLVVGSDGSVDREIAPPGGFARPTGIAYDAGRDRLYVADTPRHTVHVFTAAGRRIGSLGGRGSGPGEFNFPTYLWHDPRDGSLLVCDSMNFRIQRFGPDGVWRGAFGEYGDRPGYLARPRGVCTDADGHVYVVDGALEAVQVFDRTGRLLLFFGSAGTDAGGFALPGGIATADGETLYVADTYNARLQAFRYLREGAAAP